MIRRSVGKERREAHTICHSKVVVDHRFICIHDGLTIPEGDLKLVIDKYCVARGQEVQSILVLILVKGLEPGKL